MNARATGTYIVQLTVVNGFGASAPATKQFTVTPPAGVVNFGTIASIVTCGSGCHQLNTTTTSTLFNTIPQQGNPPPWANGNTADGATLYMRLRQRVVLPPSETTSLLLVCPHQGCGGMSNAYGVSFGSTTLGSNSTYDQVHQWINAGAPPGQ